MCQDRGRNIWRREVVGEGADVLGHATNAAPVSAGEVRARRASGSEVISCSGRLMRSQYRTTGRKVSLAVVSGECSFSSCWSTGACTRSAKESPASSEHRQPVDRGGGRAGDHVGRARADGGQARVGGEPVAHLGVGNGGVHHALLVARQVVGQLVLELLDGLGEPADVAVAEDSPDAGEEVVPLPIALDALDAEVLDECLTRGQSDCGHDESTLPDVGRRSRRGARCRRPTLWSAGGRLRRPCQGGGIAVLECPRVRWRQTLGGAARRASR